MTFDFDYCVELIGAHEKGFTNNPLDKGNYTPGGRLLGTKYGISAKSYPYLNIPALSWQQAKEIYKKDFWDKYRIGELNERIRLYTFDSIVNHGPTIGIKLLQRAIGVKDDGIIGQTTISQSIKATPNAFALARSDYYVDIVRNDISQLVFLKGWLRRSLQVLKESSITLV